MHISIRVLIIALIVVVLHACKGERANEIPISNFFKTPEKSAFKISPDGKYVSYLKPYKEKQNLFIESLADGEERMATSFSDNPVRGDYSWTYDNQIIFNQNDIATELNKMFVLDVNTLKVRTLLSEGKVKIRILNRNRQHPDIITIGMNKRDPANFDIYRLNVKTGELKPYLINSGNITEWYPDADGKIRLVKVSNGVDETILYRPKETAPFKAIIKNNFKESVTPIAFTSIKNYFYALSNVGRDKTALLEINAKNGKEEKVVFASDSADILDVQYSKNKHRLDFASWQEAKPKKHFLNGDIEHIYNNLLKHNELKGNEINITDKDSAEDKFIINTYTDRNPGSYYLYESKIDKLTHLSDNSSIQSNELCVMKPIHYKSSDGLFMINGYLTMPRGDSTNLPVVVMPHDGPFGPFNRDSWGYNPDVQFLANRGYGVLQVNYRGSTGYGKAFFSAGFKQVGGKMQQDITDGVKWMVSKKIANPKKIAIFGRGFGGFSALYGISFHPALYNCAIVQNPLINFFTYIKDAPPFFKPLLQKMYEQVGDPEKDADQLTAISPVFHADKIKNPLLIFQAVKDPRANISELRQFVSELKKRNVAVTYKSKQNERGSFRGKNRIEMYTEIEKFLDNNMRGKR
ncbi:MAG: family peptidase [Mucilaginibacter sp.]|nr:family peptidase [Mucilaginibacter sp.]